VWNRELTVMVAGMLGAWWRKVATSGGVMVVLSSMGRGRQRVKWRWRAETTTASRQENVCVRCCWPAVKARAAR
jgi:hypothetical protein